MPRPRKPPGQSRVTLTIDGETNERIATLLRTRAQGTSRATLAAECMLEGLMGAELRAGIRRRHESPTTAARMHRLERQVMAIVCKLGITAETPEPPPEPEPELEPEPEVEAEPEYVEPVWNAPDDLPDDPEPDPAAIVDPPPVLHPSFAVARVMLPVDLTLDPTRCEHGVRYDATTSCSHCLEQGF